MKRILLTTVTTLFVAFQSFGQITVDGIISDNLYFRLDESNISVQNSYGDFNDIGWLVAYTTTTDVYIGISGDLEINANNIVIFMNFGGYVGRAAGSTLGLGNAAFGSGMNNARMDMEVDYAIAVNKGTSGTNFFVDVARYGVTDPGHMASGNIGNTNSHSGDAASFNPADYWAGSGDITVAFKSGFVDTLNNQHNGVEIRIPVSTMDGVSSGVTVQFFVLITNNVGSASNESIPAMNFGGNPGDGYDFSGLDGQNLFTLNTTLPIELISLEAELINNNIHLHWTTASEINNSHFEIERSSDGNNWTTIGQVNGAGTTTTGHYYSFTDNNPALGYNYYRLRQVDFDGGYEYSEIVSGELRGSGSISMAPNPVKDVLYLSPGTEIRIFDQLGRMVFSTIVSSNSIDISNLPSGLYIADLRNGSEQRTEQLIKQ